MKIKIVMKDKCFRYYAIYILLYLMLYYVLVLVQMLSARSVVLSFNRLRKNIYFRPFICGRSVVVLQVSCHLCQFELSLNHFAFVNILYSFIVMIPLSLTKSFFSLAPYTLQFVYM